MNSVLSSNTLLTQNKIEEKILLIKKIFLCFFITFLIFSFINTFFISPNAAVTIRGNGKNRIYTLTDGTELKVSEMHNKTFGGLALGLSYLAHCGMISNTDLLTIDTGAAYWTMLDSFYQSIAAIGAGLALLWCLLDLIEKSSHGNITGEFILQLGIKLTIACVVISEGAEIAKGLVEFGNGILDLLSGNAPGGVSPAEETLRLEYKELENANIFQCVGSMINNILSAAFMCICFVIMYVLLAGRIIEICIRFVFFPIGAADVFTHGVSSPGMRYMKRFAATVLQGAGMYLVMVVGSALMTAPQDVLGSASNIITDTFFPLICGFAMVGAMLKVQSIMNDVAG